MGRLFTWPSFRVYRRFLLVVVTLLLLISSTRAGTGWPVVVVALIAYVVAVTLWVRQQYADWLSGKPLPKASFRWLLAVMAAGLVVAVAGIILSVSGALNGYVPVPVLEFAGVIGVVVFFFGVGFLVERLCRSSYARLWGVGLGGLAALLLGVGVILLPLTAWALAPLALGLFLLPGAASVLALWATEAVERRWRRSRGVRVAGWVGVGGLLVVVLAVWQLVSGPSAILLLVVGLLAFALVSATKADIAVVLGAVALLSVTPMQEPAPKLPRDAAEPSLFILGDSYMSGEGAAVYYQGTDDAGVNGCRRAPRTWAEQLGDDEFRGHTFNLSCSGATGANIRYRSAPGLPAPQVQYDNEQGTQLQRVRALRAARADDGVLHGRHRVVLSIGGNDAGFSTVGMMCLAPGSCADESGRWLDDPVFDRVEQALDATYADVRATFPDAEVLVTPYPDPIWTPAPRIETKQRLLATADTSPERCDQVALSVAEGDFVRGFLSRLNDRVGTVAARYGFQVIDTMPGSLREAGLQLCDPANNGRPGLNFIRLRSVNGLAQQRMNPANWVHNSLHPNERGHQAMYTAYRTWAADHDLTPTPGDASRPPAFDARGSCDVLDLDAGCRSEGDAWIRSQVAWALFFPGTLILLYGFLAWLAAVAVFARRQPPPEPEPDHAVERAHAEEPDEALDGSLDGDAEAPWARTGAG